MYVVLALPRGHFLNNNVSFLPRQRFSTDTHPDDIFCTCIKTKPKLCWREHPLPYSVFLQNYPQQQENVITSCRNKSKEYPSIGYGQLSTIPRRVWYREIIIQITWEVLHHFHVIHKKVAEIIYRRVNKLTFSKLPRLIFFWFLLFIPECSMCGCIAL
jgi:hypothetical protein